MIAGGGHYSVGWNGHHVVGIVVSVGILLSSERSWGGPHRLELSSCQLEFLSCRVEFLSVGGNKYPSVLLRKTVGWNCPGAGWNIRIIQALLRD
jgi:hypothetical protein